ncbi:DnaD domain-containing protein [Brevibacillus borstelensis]|uniref:DnaD domain-containing protein n=1 Tax=Brevibacillus borstelensis TaxID=45462 RepID=UPI00046A8CC1|nr:DnaD domain protein [Brevibacillus borstelensis]
MATYRQVQTSFWQDGFVLDLTPEEKYFFLYLMTNSKTSQCGIYELPKRIIETETGYNRETVDKLLQRFIDYGKIAYNESTKEIMMVNWLKYNRINSPKVKACITKELKGVKHQAFVELFHSLCIQYGYGIDTVSIDYGEEKEKEKEEEKEVVEEAAEAGAATPPDKNSTNTGNASVKKADPITFYMQNITPSIPPIIIQDIDQWIEKGHFDEPEAVIVEALKETILNGTKSWKYTTKILIGWADQGLRTLQQVQAAIAEHERNKNAGSRSRTGRARQTDKTAADQAQLDKLRGGQAVDVDPSYDPGEDLELQQLMGQLQSKGDGEQ